MVYADIILPLPLEGVFTYSVPDGMTAAVMPGMRVVVPFGRSKNTSASYSGRTERNRRST